MTIQRYHSWNSEDDEDGHYVAYDDYAELESAHKAAMLTISRITDVVGTSDTLSISGQVAALASSAAEHQAQGVEKYAVIYEKNAENYPLDSYAWREVMAKRDKVLEFANQLRKEAGK